jgi:hypothetical protein
VRPDSLAVSTDSPATTAAHVAKDLGNFFLGGRNAGYGRTNLPRSFAGAPFPEITARSAAGAEHSVKQLDNSKKRR